MSFINKFSFNPLSVTQEPQPEVPSTPTPEPREVTSLGIGGGADQFENAPNNFYYLEQQAQSATLIQPSTTRDLTVDASSLFSSFETSVGQLDNHLPQLMDRLDSLKGRQQELTSQINDVQNQRLKAQEALQIVIDAIQNEKLIPEEIYSLLGNFGDAGCPS